MSNSENTPPIELQSDCPGAPDLSHLLALILFDHCEVCNDKRVNNPGVSPRRGPGLIGSLTLTVAVVVVVVLAGTALAATLVGAW